VLGKTAHAQHCSHEQVVGKTGSDFDRTARSVEVYVVQVGIGRLSGDAVSLLNLTFLNVQPDGFTNARMKDASRGPRIDECLESF
jgi:hypothetical protein